MLCLRVDVRAYQQNASSELYYLTGLFMAVPLEELRSSKNKPRLSTMTLELASACLCISTISPPQTDQSLLLKSWAMLEGQIHESAKKTVR